MRHDSFGLESARGLDEDFVDWDFDVWLHQVLRVLVPHVVLPFALHTLSLLHEHVALVVAQWLSAELLGHFGEVVHNLVEIHIPQWLLLHVPVDERRCHVWMMVSSHLDIEFQVLVNLKEVDEL